LVSFSRDIKAVITRQNEAWDGADTLAGCRGRKSVRAGEIRVRVLMMMIILGAVLCGRSSHADDIGDTGKLPAISDMEVKALVANVRTNWRAQDGETVEEITTRASKAAHFVPRRWDVVQTTDGSNKSVVLS
jgi:hypothetical protein